jgi:hypothetical protein
VGPGLLQAATIKLSPNPRLNRREKALVECLNQNPEVGLRKDDQKSLNKNSLQPLNTAILKQLDRRRLDMALEFPGVEPKTEKPRINERP